MSESNRCEIQVRLSVEFVEIDRICNCDRIELDYLQRIAIAGRSADYKVEVPVDLRLDYRGH